jgi:hypothetical protein
MTKSDLQALEKIVTAVYMDHTIPVVLSNSERASCRRIMKNVNAQLRRLP